MTLQMSRYDVWKSSIRKYIILPVITLTNSTSYKRYVRSSLNRKCLIILYTNESDRSLSLIKYLFISVTNCSICPTSTLAYSVYYYIVDETRGRRHHCIGIRLRLNPRKNNNIIIIESDVEKLLLLSSGK